MKATQLDLAVVGMKYRCSVSTRRMIQSHVEDGDVECLLVREPRNNHDTNAVKVVIDTDPYKGFHIGYVDRVVAAVLAPVLDAGAEVIVAMLNEMDAEEATATMSVSLKTPAQAKKKKSKRNT